MAVHNLDGIFKPQRIALLGVTPNPKSVGGSVLQNLIGGGFRGVVYPVNPTSEAVLGIQCYPNLDAVPRTPDLAIICTPAEQVPDVVTNCGEKGIRGVIIISAGFRETGFEGKAIEDRVRAAASAFPKMRLIGPNCLGIIAPHTNFNASFAGAMPKAGHVAFISQSGALCTSVLDWALEEKIGFSYFVSIGNSLDVDFADLIDYFGEDEKTQSIILYIESIRDARKFMTAARAFARTKPIVAYKAGRFPESAEVAASHTGAMAAEDAVYDAAFQRAGIVRVFDIGDIFNYAELVGRHKLPGGPRLGIVTNAGGPAVMATDTLIAHSGTLAVLSAETMETLNQNLPPFWSRRNPVDILGDANSKRLAKAAGIVLEDKNVDALLIILTPQSMTNPTAAAKAVVQLGETSGKPILAAWLGGRSMKDGMDILMQNGIATYNTPEQAVRAFMCLTSYSRNLETLYETPKDIPVSFPLDRKKLRDQFLSLTTGGSLLLSESVSKKILESYGIPVTSPVFAPTSADAAAIAERIGFPVVMKIQSPDITHKSDSGGVILDLKDSPAVNDAFDRIMKQVSLSVPGANLEGVTIQKMIQEQGVELILGARQDAVFGTVVMVGLGGTGAELYNDRSLGFPPLNERLARRMLESLKAWPLLRGFRGKPPVNLDRLLEIIMRLSYLVADFPEVKELDINPLLATADDVIAMDARLILSPDRPLQPVRPFAHLALRPYPEEFVRSVELSDGTTVLLRPIRPEDEPIWKELLASCSRETIYMRFRYMFHWESHDVATRYCYIDYDREIAIVAEYMQEGHRRLMGVGRLVCEPGNETGEYAVLVADEWQNKGLGGILTDFCVEIARKWQLKSIVAQTTPDNSRMITLFRNRDFTLDIESSGSLLDVRKPLD
ncbi:GNAT family N-acetyltransferase [bacterium]|nr:GNAT family N-acetyltransferase [candidate division CSSED10-310 bacterium]